MNGSLGTNWGRRAEQLLHLGNYTLTHGYVYVATNATVTPGSMKNAAWPQLSIANF